MLSPSDRLEKVNQDAIKKYMLKVPEKGNSWLDCNVLYLYDKLMEEIEEYKTAVGSKKSGYDELLDIINMAKMLGARENRK